MPLFRTVDRLRDLKETILDAAPPASATAPLFQLGQALIGGNALGTVLGGRQLNGYLGDYLNWQGTDVSGSAKNRLSLSPTGLLTLGDTDLGGSSILLRGNNTGNNVVQFGITGGVPFLTIYDGGAGCTKTIGRTDHNSKSWGSFVLPTTGAGGWLMAGRGGGILLGTDVNLTDRFFFDDTGHAVVGAGTILASAAFQVDSTTRGLLAPRVTTAQRDAIASPAEGLEVYNTTTHKKAYFNGTVWVEP